MRNQRQLNFTIGPVMSEPGIIEIANQSTPYFRTPGFSEIMKENEGVFLSLLNAPNDARAVFLTSSGTGAMESCVMNILNDDDHVIVINGGSFGQRFVDLCKLHKRKYTEVKCEFGKQIKSEQLNGLESYSALLINMHETSSGVLYDMDLISDFCTKNHILLIVDAISAFIADELNMESLGADVVITGSQKALAVQPGVSLIALSSRAIERVKDNDEVCLYLSLKQALVNGERGQTPFTPAVMTLLQLNERLKGIRERGIDAERMRIAEAASFFRNSLSDFHFEFVSESPSNAVTCLRTTRNNAMDIINIMKDVYHIWICPNGGELANSVFRVGHIGHITAEDNQTLVDAFMDMKNRGLL